MSKSKAQNKTLSAADILAIDDLGREKIEVKEWNGHVYMRVLSMEEVESLTKDSADKGGGKKEISNTKILAAVLCDEKGKLLFDEKQIADLGKKNSRVILKLVKEALRINGLDVEAEEKQVKNS